MRRSVKWLGDQHISGADPQSVDDSSAQGFLFSTNKYDAVLTADVKVHIFIYVSMEGVTSIVSRGVPGMALR